MRDLLIAIALLAPACVAATPAPQGPERQQAEAVVEAFHRALDEGRRDDALALLADDLIVLEGGGAERSKAEYAAVHLDSDMEFSKAVKGQITNRTAAVGSDLAWVATEGRSSGQFRGKDVNQVTAETMVLKRSPAGWRIVHIHWSSSAAR